MVTDLKKISVFLVYNTGVQFKAVLNLKKPTNAAVHISSEK